MLHYAIIKMISHVSSLFTHSLLFILLFLISIHSYSILYPLSQLLSLSHFILSLLSSFQVPILLLALPLFLFRSFFITLSILLSYFQLFISPLVFMPLSLLSLFLVPFLLLLYLIFELMVLFFALNLEYLELILFQEF